ncbi:ABC-F family ATP-binding cassette domain-containing protein [Dethiosulfatarculus sandiegensis]|uniref:ABC transporter ATP-binding protein n=1 Tax=Dethiosulfatarculus sandiegensis TaxID=1429043 RepID=A0A0D2GB50_9BACT|nr:ABC-F family ATP-binding cassette domain-containing protein [Dethiosulfatarculus sandiegensis]KIX12077.1 ABC transporter ATP-binding protein [Dethiosulfatarculus sandiegensis]
MITLHQVQKYFGRQDVLRDASLHVGPGERMGLVGPNGAGKSTILKVVLGEVDPDGGEVFKAKGIKVGYLPQDLVQFSGQTVLELAMDTGDRIAKIEEEIHQIHADLANDPDPEEIDELLARQGQLQTIFEGLGGYDLEARAQKVLAGLGFRPEQLNRDVGELSGGWLMRAALARILLSAPDVILLDEPTNHLDMESLLWLEGQLVKSGSSIVLVSHDRVFMDKVVNRIVEVEDGKLYTYGGNYTEYEVNREARRKAQQAAYEQQQERIKEIQTFIDKNRARADTAKQVQGRIKQLEKMERLKPPPSEECLALELPPVERSAKVVVELLDVDLSYGEKKVYQGLDFQVQRGDRLALLGRNGAGKSTLLKLLAGIIPPTKGRRLVGGRVKMGVFSQHALEDLNPENDVLNELSGVAGLMPQSRLRSVLGVFLFKGDEVFKKVKVLSGGERSRLVLAKLLLQSPNVLFLDEPTNHLDIGGRQVLEQALKNYDGTVVIVTHDRHMIDSVANKVVHVDDGNISIFPGNYTDFARLWRSRLEQGGEAPKKAAATGSKPDQPKPKSQEAKRARAEARNALYRKLKPLKDKLAKVEEEVEQATQRLDELTSRMVEVTPQDDWSGWQELSKEHNQVQSRLEELSTKWEDLALAVEEAEEQAQID